MTARMRLAGRLTYVDVAFSSLAGNRLGDPETRTIPVYLPPGYDGERRFATIYWLHGFGANALSEVNVNPWYPSVVESLDAAIIAGAPPTMLVHVDGFTRYGASQFVNSTATGCYEDAVLELVRAVDARFSTLPAAAHRALNGKSSGGFGALFLAMRHPDVFSAAASHSGDLYFEACYLPGFWSAADTVRRYGGLARFLQAFEAAPKKPPEATRALATAVAMAMAYSPDDAAAEGFVLPFDPDTGELDTMTWRRWQAFDPVHMAPTHGSALRALRDIYVECGSRDQFHGHYGGRIFSRRLRDLGVAHEYQEFDDDHANLHYRYAASLRRQCEVIAA